MREYGTWIQTVTGRRIDLEYPHPDDIDIEDIAHSLSLKCRFGGHTKVFYSVAEHCINTAMLLSPALRLAGLLHDASETYLTDMSSPLKYILREYEFIENLFEAVIYERYKIVLTDADGKEIKKADNIMLATEARDLVGDTTNWVLPEPPLSKFFAFGELSSKEVKKLYLFLFKGWYTG